MLAGVPYEVCFNDKGIYEFLNFPRERVREKRKLLTLKRISGFLATAVEGKWSPVIFKSVYTQTQFCS